MFFSIFSSCSYAASDVTTYSPSCILLEKETWEGYRQEIIFGYGQLIQRYENFFIRIVKFRYTVIVNMDTSI